MADIVMDSMDKVYENGFVAVQDLDKQQIRYREKGGFGRECRS